MANYIPLAVSFLVTLFNGTNPKIPINLWEWICSNVSLNIGGATGTLDPLQLGNVASVSGGVNCHNDCCFFTFWEGASGYAGLATLSGLKTAVADQAGTTVQYLCTSSTVGTLVLTMPVSGNLMGTCNFGFQVGPYIPWVPCIRDDQTVNIATSVTVDAVLSIPFTVVNVLGVPSAQLDLTTSTLKLENCRNLSLVSSLESVVRDALDGLTLGIAAISSIWDATLQPLFDELTNTIDNALNNNVLTIVPKNVIANAIPAQFATFTLPFTGNLCPSPSVSMSSLSAAASISSSEAAHMTQILRNHGMNESQVAYALQQYKMRRVKAALDNQRKIQLAQYMKQRKAAKKQATLMRVATSCHHHKK